MLSSEKTNFNFSLKIITNIYILYSTYYVQILKYFIDTNLLSTRYNPRY